MSLSYQIFNKWCSPDFIGHTWHLDWNVSHSIFPLTNYSKLSNPFHHLPQQRISLHCPCFLHLSLTHSHAPWCQERWWSDNYLVSSIYSFTFIIRTNDTECKYWMLIQLTIKYKTVKLEIYPKPSAVGQRLLFKK